MEAVLAATVFMMHDESILPLAVDGVRMDNVRLEGVGVTPKISVLFTAGRNRSTALQGG